MTLRPWFRNGYFGIRPINPTGWLFGAAAGFGFCAFFLAGVALTEINKALALVLIPLFAWLAFRLNTIVANRTRND